MSDGIGKNPLNDISKVYLDKVASQETTEEGYKEIDRSKENRMYRRAGNLARTGLASKGKKKEDALNKSNKIVSAISRQKEKERFAKMGDEKARDNYKEGLDPVGQEDGDINNDGKKDKTDKYLMNRRKKIGKAIAANEAVDKRDEAAMKKFQELQKKVDQKKKLKQEQFSDWRADLQEQGLIEVMDETEADKPIKEKKVNNKVKINPKLGEAIEEIGGTLIEEIEDHEFDEIVQSVYDELIEEGYSEEDVEDAIEFALTEQLNEVSDSYYDSAVKSSKAAAAKIKRAEMMKRAKGRLRFMKRKAGEVANKLKGKVAGAAAAATMAPGIAKDQARRTGRAVKQAVTSAPGKAKKSLKDRIKKGALAVAKRMSEENELDEAKKKLPYVKMFRKAGNLGRDGSPEAMERSKKITGVMNKNAERVAAHRERDDAAKDAKKAKMKEELSVDDQMKISRDYNRMTPEQKRAANKKAMGNVKKVAPKKDTRTDAQKMTDAVGKPRMGSSD